MPIALRRLALVSSVALAAALAAAAAPASAQYFYLDVDGDGKNLNENLEWPPPTDTTTVDVYVVTDKNMDGTSALCESGDAPLDLWYYTLNIVGNGDAFEVVGVESQIPGMVALFPPFLKPYGITVGYSIGTRLPPGTYFLLRLKVVFARSGYCPNMTIVSSSCYSLPGVGTEFGSDCAGLDGDFIFPIQGLGFGFCTDPPNRRPTVVAPAETSVVEGQPITFPVTVTDPECGGSYLFSFFTEGIPSGASCTGLSSFVYGQATATFSWTPTKGQAGSYSAIFTAHDPDTWNWWIPPDVSDTTHIVVEPTLSANQAPTARSGGPYSGRRGVPIEFHGAASIDPDGDALTYAWVFGDGATATGATATHSFANGGVFDVTLTVTDRGGLTSTDRTTATIAPRGGLGRLIAWIAPNPMTPRSRLAFTTTRDGYASARLFDVRGRLVAAPFEVSWLSAGDHVVPSVAGNGMASLRSGVYFLQLTTEHDGAETRRVTVLR